MYSMGESLLWNKANQEWEWKQHPNALYVRRVLDLKVPPLVIPIINQKEYTHLLSVPLHKRQEITNVRIPQTPPGFTAEIIESVANLAEFYPKKDRIKCMEYYLQYPPKKQIKKINMKAGKVTSRNKQIAYHRRKIQMDVQTNNSSYQRLPVYVQSSNIDYRCGECPEPILYSLREIQNWTFPKMKKQLCKPHRVPIARKKLETKQNIIDHYQHDHHITDFDYKPAMHTEESEMQQEIESNGSDVYCVTNTMDTDNDHNLQLNGNCSAFGTEYLNTNQTEDFTEKHEYELRSTNLRKSVSRSHNYYNSAQDISSMTSDSNYELED
eukprot:8034_1